MKTNLFDKEGKKLKEIELPKCFSEEIRDDILSRVLETKKTKQPYSNSPVAGKQYSASGILVHRRHVWKSQYGRGMSRVPRKVMIKRGSQFHWEGATSPNTRGGRRAHYPKAAAGINTKNINKKEMEKALKSAISSTGDKKKISEKYSSLKEDDMKNMSFPLVIESGITSLKTKELLSGMKKILGNLYDIALKKKEIRSGKGKLRGRKYKKSAGMLIVTGKDENLNTTAFEVKKASNIGIRDLAEGGPGRLTVYTEKAIKELNERFSKK